MDSAAGTPTPMASVAGPADALSLPVARPVDYDAQIQVLRQEIQGLRDYVSNKSLARGKQISAIRDLFRHMDQLSRATTNNMNNASDLSQQMNDQYDFLIHSNRLLWATVQNMNSAQDSNVRRVKIEMSTHEPEPNAQGRVFIDLVIDGVHTAYAGHSTSSDSEADADSESNYGSAQEEPQDPALFARLRLRM